MRMIIKGALFAALLVLTGCSQPQTAGSILLGGDVMLSRGGVPLFQEAPSSAQPWNRIKGFLNQNRDNLFVVNLESPFGSLPQGLDEDHLQRNLCADPGEVSILEGGGVDLVTRENNHVLDCLAQGESAEAQFFADHNLIEVSEQDEVAQVDWDGKKIAFLALDDVSSELSVSKYADQIQSARTKSDLVVVSIHWGLEYQAGPTRRQQQLAQELVNAGADVIWGHHPHVLQKMEWLSSSVDGHTALVMYSLGNLLADQWMLPDAQRTVLVRLDFSNHEIHGIRIIPLEMNLSTKKLAILKEAEEREAVEERLGLAGLEKPGVNVRLQMH
jgi:poly-gamma-glutamate capsule biosynthesis protein CapA/YwtB (metallophosphatase superfamily)